MEKYVLPDCGCRERVNKVFVWKIAKAKLLINEKL